jgi:hypothetical protein
MVIAEAERTLVKSPPELWSELSDPAALARHLGELGEIRIVRTAPEQSVEWESEDKRGRVEIQPSGWGTKVTLSVTIEPSHEPDSDEPAASTPAGSAPGVAPSPAPKPALSLEPPSPEPAPRPASQSSPKPERTPTPAPQAREAATSSVGPEPAAEKTPEGEPADAAPGEPAVTISEPAGRPHAPANEDRPSRGPLWRIRKLGRALRGQASAEKGDQSTDPHAGREHALGAPQTVAAIAEPRSTGDPVGELRAGAHSASASRATGPCADTSASRATSREVETSASRATRGQPEDGAEHSTSRTREDGKGGITKPPPTPVAGQDNGTVSEPRSREREEPHTAPAEPSWSRAREEPQDPASHPPGSRARGEATADGAEEQVARTTELLSAMLDSLGEAHHRPFSRA